MTVRTVDDPPFPEGPFPSAPVPKPWKKTWAHTASAWLCSKVVGAAPGSKRAPRPMQVHEPSATKEGGRSGKTGMQVQGTVGRPAPPTRTRGVVGLPGRWAGQRRARAARRRGRYRPVGRWLAVGARPHIVGWRPVGAAGGAGRTPPSRQWWGRVRWGAPSVPPAGAGTAWKMVAGDPLAVELAPAWRARFRACARVAATGRRPPRPPGYSGPIGTPRPPALAPRTAANSATHRLPLRGSTQAVGPHSSAARPPRQPPAGERSPASAG